MLKSIAAIFILVTQVHGQCEQGWVRYEEKCYIKSSTKATFLGNNKWCRSLNATMVSVHGYPQNEFLRTYIPGTWTWLGGIQSSPGVVGNMWLDGSEWNFKNNTGNPSCNPSCGWYIHLSGVWGWSGGIHLPTFYYQMCQKLVKDVQKENDLREMKAQLKVIEQALNESLLGIKSLEERTRKDMLIINRNLSSQSLESSENRQSLNTLNTSLIESKLDIQALNESLSEINEKTVSKCPIGWKLYLDNCYISNETEATFEQNIEWCRSINASMISIHSKDENDFVLSIIRGSTWLGANQTEVRFNQHVWLDSTLTDYDNFNSTSRCLPGCGLYMRETGQWAFEYTHDHFNLRHSMCRKMTGEMERELTLRDEYAKNMERINLMESRYFESPANGAVGDLQDQVSLELRATAENKLEIQQLTDKYVFGLIVFVVVVVLLLSLVFFLSFTIFRSKRKQIPVYYSKKEPNLEIFDAN